MAVGTGPKKKTPGAQGGPVFSGGEKHYDYRPVDDDRVFNGNPPSRSLLTADELPICHPAALV